MEDLLQSTILSSKMLMIAAARYSGRNVQNVLKTRGGGMVYGVV